MVRLEVRMHPYPVIDLDTTVEDHIAFLVNSVLEQHPEYGDCAVVVRHDKDCPRDRFFCWATEGLD